MMEVLNSFGYSKVADEFETMEIEYPYTIIKYRGNSTSGPSIQPPPHGPLHPM